MTQLEPENQSKITESCKWGAFLNKGFAIWVVSKVSQGDTFASGNPPWSRSSGVVVQICAPKTNLGYFYEEVIVLVK